PDSILSRLDLVVAAVHSHFELPREAQTRRVVRAMDNPHVSIIAHPTGRLIGQRAPYDLDFGQIVDVAQRQRVSHVHHHDKTDDLRRAVKISEWIAHDPSLPRSEAPRPSSPLNKEFFFPIAIGRIDRSTVFVSGSSRPSLRNAVSDGPGLAGPRHREGSIESASEPASTRRSGPSSSP